MKESKKIPEAKTWLVKKGIQIVIYDTATSQRKITEEVIHNTVRFEQN